MSLLNLKIPSKTFLLGEYAVLYGGPIVVLTHPPFFRKDLNPNPSLFHPESPAARLMRECSLLQDFNFIDPHQGGGGFGGSTAEVVASLKDREIKLSIGTVHKKYLKLFSKSSIQPSGADLYAQWMESGSHNFLKASICVFQGSHFQRFDWPFHGNAILIYKRPKKIKTHSHLESLAKETSHFESLKKISITGVESLMKGEESFFDSIIQFSEEQKSLGLIDDEAYVEVQSLLELPEVHSARACGAMGMDVVVVFCSLQEDLDNLKAKIVDLNFEYQLVEVLNEGDFKSDKKDMAE